MSRPKSGLVAGAVLLSGLGLGLATASPAAAYDGYCNSYVERTKTFSGTTHTAYIPSYNRSTNCYMNSGATSSAVGVLQRSLNVCYGRSLTIDGIFGPATKAALEYAQDREGIGVDGKYGNQSRDHLKWEFSHIGSLKCVRL
ncbi:MULTISPECIES: peptidoglycan-binding domain-containing protein [Streptomyces]|uniref:Peptidoglycan-binding protein n=1 Tax=Streptomyces liliifuscus TaxID=2797636 RepID=A0A7T7KWJ8_9ACTN|nr:peptidoglycan-binding domain-containing protein [Streptomyces liliifuscus]QQM41285.1 peptidoglycan-binding protein [Streptomyces liliifuscus]